MSSHPCVGCVKSDGCDRGHCAKFHEWWLGSVSDVHYEYHPEVDMSGYVPLRERVVEGLCKCPKCVESLRGIGIVGEGVKVGVSACVVGNQRDSFGVCKVGGLVCSDVCFMHGCFSCARSVLLDDGSCLEPYCPFTQDVCGFMDLDCRDCDVGRKGISDNYEVLGRERFVKFRKSK